MTGLTRTITLGGIGAIVCVGFVLVGIYPYRPATTWGWVVLFLAAVPIVVAYERVGDRISKTTRLIYGVVVVVLVIAASWFLLHTAKPYLTTWSG